MVIQYTSWHRLIRKASSLYLPFNFLKNFKILWSNLTFRHFFLPTQTRILEIMVKRVSCKARRTWFLWRWVINANLCPEIFWNSISLFMYYYATCFSLLLFWRILSSYAWLMLKDMKHLYDTQSSSCRYGTQDVDEKLNKA